MGMFVYTIRFHNLQLDGKLISIRMQISKPAAGINNDKYFKRIAFKFIYIYKN